MKSEADRLFEKGKSMKRLFVAAVVGVFLLSGVAAQAMTLDEFMEKSAAYGKGKMTLAQYEALCAAELAGDAQEDTDYRAQVYANRALAYMNAKQLDKAKADNGEALRLSPASARALVNEAELLAAEGDYHAAYAKMNALTARAKEKGRTGIAEYTHSKAVEYREAAAVTAVALWRAFDANEVAAEDKYKGKSIFVTGKIRSITTDPAGYPVVALDAGKSGFATVSCVFPKDARSTIAVLKKGQQVLIPGTCDGMILGQVFVKDCKVE